MDAEDRHGAPLTVIGLEREATALAKIMENVELIAALARAERERCAQLVENFPIREGALLTRNAMAQAIRGLA